MDFTTNDPLDEALTVCAEARQLCVLHQELHRDTLRLLGAFKSICAQGRERLAQAQQRQASRNTQARLLGAGLPVPADQEEQPGS